MLAKPFVIDEIIVPDDTVVLSLSGSITKCLADFLKLHREPTMRALGHSVAISGMILSGVDRSKFPTFADIVTDQYDDDDEDDDDLDYDDDDDIEDIRRVKEVVAV